MKGRSRKKVRKRSVGSIIVDVSKVNVKLKVKVVIMILTTVNMIIMIEGIIKYLKPALALKHLYFTFTHIYTQNT